MTGWMPRSPRARRRLTILAVVAPVLALAAGLTLWGLGDSISYFYTPAQADEARPPPGRSVQLGGLVVDGSVVRHPDGRVEFSIRDNRATDRIHYRGDLPDLFREGQGIVATGAFRSDGVFEARQVLAKHDETYMPKQVADSLKAQGEWRGDGAPRPAP
jgi:cytochrome c-type biogenesis protein CcmE